MYDFPVYLDGEWIRTGDELTILSPYDRSKVGTTYLTGDPEISRAIDSASHAFRITRSMGIYERSEKLLRIADALREHQEEFARIISAEAGKPVKSARQEVARAALTFTDSAEEAKRIRGEYLPLDFEAGSKGRWGIIRHFPLGPILGISPFNFPLNLIAHKIAPALASGNTMILKPASQTPLCALRLAQEIDKTGWPAGALQVLPMKSEKAGMLVKDDRIKMVTFTGSPAVGWSLKQQASTKRVTLELGGNAGVIIHDDADIEFAAERCAYGGYVLAGQNCISVQRIYVQERCYDRFLEIFSRRVRQLKSGDPSEDDTDVGPLIHPSETERVRTWMDEAVSGGATIQTGGSFEGNVLSPTIITGADPRMKVSCQEVFAPLVVVYRYKNFEDALEMVNDSEYGLQAGVFTRDAGRIFKAFETLEVGGVIAGDVPTYRIDPMPYGGVKQSGMGREGARFAIAEMTEPRLIVMNLR